MPPVANGAEIDEPYFFTEVYPFRGDQLDRQQEALLVRSFAPAAQVPRWIANLNFESPLAKGTKLDHLPAATGRWSCSGLYVVIRCG